MESRKSRRLGLSTTHANHEKMWLAGELDAVVNIEKEELEIARMNPWGGSAAIIASDGLFNFGAGNAD